MTNLSKRFNSEFNPIAFVVDPIDCGCTDCGLGYSTPANRLNREQVAEAMVLGMELVDRRGQYDIENTLSSLTEDQRTELMLFLMFDDRHAIQAVLNRE